MVPRPNSMGFVWGGGTSANAVCALFNHFCYASGFDNLGDPVLPTVRGVSGDLVTLYDLIWIRKDVFSIL